MARSHPESLLYIFKSGNNATNLGYVNIKFKE